MNKKMIPLLIIICGSLLTVGGAFYDYKNKLKEKQEQLDTEIKRNQEYQTLLGKSNNIISKSNNIISTQQTVIDSSNKIINLQNQLDNKNNKIQELQNSTLNYVTGGKSVPILDFIVAGGVSVYIKVSNKSKYPIRNFNIHLTRIIDDLFGPDTNGTREAVSLEADKDWDFEIGDLSIDSENKIYEERYPVIYDKVSYIYYVKWLNGFYTGGFSVINGKTGVTDIIENNVTDYSTDLNMENAVRVNYVHSKVNPIRHK